MWPFQWTSTTQAPVLERCRVRLYEPGANHEHTCLASSAHPGLDHTCAVWGCGKTWPDLIVGGERCPE
jgi:hypothetical protein